MKSLLLLLVIAFALPPLASALTIDQEVTPEYVREHPKQISVSVKKDADGLLSFHVVFELPDPRYAVAHLVVRSGGHVTAKSDTPTFARKGKNSFYFSIPSEALGTSEFTLGVSHITTKEDELPAPGSIDYRFRLPPFVPAELLR